MFRLPTDLLAEGSSWLEIVNYELLRGNPVWRFALLLGGILVTMIIGRVVQFCIRNYVEKQKQKGKVSVTSLVMEALEKPLYVVVFALGLKVCEVFLYFDAERGISPVIGEWWDKVVQVVLAMAGIYALYRLVDVIEHYLNLMVSKTQSKLDDMLVPVVRKAIRMTVVIIGVLYVAEMTVGTDKVKTILLGAGVGGIAIALAAKDTIANIFGSVTIFADRPFQIDDLVKISGFYGTVEEVGFRSTRIRTTQGHLVTIPNNTVANADIENVGKRPFIRRTSNLTITYDSGSEKTTQAVQIVKQVLSEAAELNTDPDRLPRVYFSEFNDSSLNIYMTYWVKPADWWLYHEVNERVNIRIMKRFEEAGIEFAFPTQTVYVKQDDEPVQRG
jgi:MscS family membrane protein